MLRQQFKTGGLLVRAFSRKKGDQIVRVSQILANVEIWMHS